MRSQPAPKRLSKLRRQSEAVAALLKQLSHPQKLLILCCLAEKERSVGEIEDFCGASQSAVSQFLKAMRFEGLVASRRAGKQIYYRIEDDRIYELMNAMVGIFCK